VPHSIAIVRRIAVIGCGGAGKTTFANELGRRLGLPVLHVDSFYWRDCDGTGQAESTPEEWRRTHDEMIDREQWVIDGMKLGVLEARLAAADTVIFLDVPRRTCLWGVLKRRLRYRGQMRPDIGVYDRINTEFIRWIWSFGNTARPRIMNALDKCSCNVVILRSRGQARAFLQVAAHPQSTPGIDPKRRPTSQAG